MEMLVLFLTLLYVHVVRAEMPKKSKEDVEEIIDTNGPFISLFLNCYSATNLSRPLTSIHLDKC